MEEKIQQILCEIKDLKENVKSQGEKNGILLKSIDNILEEQKKIRETFRAIFKDGKEFKVFINENKKEMDELRREVLSLKDSVDFFSKEYEDNKIKMENLVKENKELKNVGELMEQRLKESEKDLLFVKNRSEGLVRKYLSCNIELSNVNEINEEKLGDFAKNLILKCNMVYNEKLVLNVYRKRKTLKGNLGNVIIKFNCTFDKDQMLKGLRAKRISNNDLGLEGDKQVFGREMLTPESEHIFFKTLNFKKENGWMFVWIRNGKIFIRKSIGAQCFLIKSLEDISKLVK